MKEIFDSSSFNSSKLLTKAYSTSFSLGIKLLKPSIRPAIYAIYGFVRQADEIVDSFGDYDQETLLTEFIEDYHKSLDRKISVNLILNAFQKIVHEYELYDLVEDFLKSMSMDLTKHNYDSVDDYEQYIYGSADVVGLMCLRVFVNGDCERYHHLKSYAIRLGSAFQKVNFLRDIGDDFHKLGRSYFPNMKGGIMSSRVKGEIIADIQNDFDFAYKGIVQLPLECKFGVYMAYRYYLRLLHNIKKRKAENLMDGRIRVSNKYKAYILFKSFLRFKANML